MQIALKLIQGAFVHVSFELDHTVEIDPKISPPPSIEFRFVIGAQIQIAIATGQAQQIPNLLLPTIISPPLPFTQDDGTS